MDNFYWSTDRPLSTNVDAMDEFINKYLNYHCGGEYSVVYHEGTYAEIENHNGISFGVHAGGDGDFNNHVINFVKIK